MSALLDQFVEEASDLLESAGGALLVLERNPDDDRAINDLFRSVHTLKGTSALFELPALTKLVHAGEDLLDAVREGAIPVSGELVDIQLEVLDLLRSWVDALRAEARLPDDAAAVSTELVSRLAAAKAGKAAAAPVAAPAPRAEKVGCDWLAELHESDRIAAFTAALGERLALIAIEYAPDADCYFRGEDPLLTCRGIPDLVALRIDPVGPPVPLAEFDPYACRLRFRALTTAPRSELDHLFRYVNDQVRLSEVAPHELILPIGTAVGDAACRELEATCAPLIADARFEALRARVAETLAELAADARAASALRWMLAVLDCSGADAGQAAWLAALTRAAGGAPLRLNAPADGAERAASAPLDVIEWIVAEQLQILALPVAEAAVLAGRIASVGRTLANIAAARGAADAAASLETAAAAALLAGDPRGLRDAALGWFDGLNVMLPRATETRAAGPAAAAAAGPAAAAARDGKPPRMLKVDQAKVDRLMALIGELVVAKNALPFLARRAEQVHGSRELSREIEQRYSVIDRLAQEMQGAIMEVRLLPVSEVFARFPRLIRDIARKLDKQIELVLEGEETQADKNIIELLGDPLIHIVRNAADHGIETPQARLANGKPAHGTIRLRAMQEGDLVVIEVSDDGRGIDTDRVIAKALDHGIIDADAAARMTPAEAANLIFHPGLSTAEAVSDLSGRGVGMDVVQTMIRESGGSVTVTSQPGAGTVVRLALPLSMAVMRVMTIETAGALYGVPIGLIAETVRVDAQAIRRIKQSEAFMLRDTIVPLVRLRRLLRLPSWVEEREAVLVLRMPGGLVGLVVDGFDEHMDIILKPLEGILVGLRGFAGTALLGDGRVLMVLNVKELL